MLENCVKLSSFCIREWTVYLFVLHIIKQMICKKRRRRHLKCSLLLVGLWARIFFSRFQLTPPYIPFSIIDKIQKIYVQLYSYLPYVHTYILGNYLEMRVFSQRVKIYWSRQFDDQGKKKFRQKNPISIS